MDLPELVLVVIYVLLLSFVIIRWKFFSRFSINPKIIVLIFIIKVISGICYGFIVGGDANAYFNDSRIVFSTLKDNLLLYLRLVFGLSYGNPAPELVPFKDAMSYYTTPGSYLLVRFHSIVRLISLGYYNVHVVFYNFITLVGILYLFRFLLDILPAKKNLLIAVVFLFPSILFWASGMHKEGVFIFALGILLSSTHEILTSTQQKSFQRISMLLLTVAAAFIIIYYARNFLFLLLLPFLTAWIITLKFPKHKLIKFAAVTIIWIFAVLNLNFIVPGGDLINRIVVMQKEFKDIAGQSTQVTSPSIEPSLSGILTAIPMALKNCFLEPQIVKSKNIWLLFSAAENLIIIILLLSALIIRKNNLSHAEQSLCLFSLFFAFSIFIVTGITVPILGALVRYKITGVLFLLIAAVVVVDDKFTTKKSRLIHPGL